MLKLTVKEKREVVFEKKEYPNLYSIIQKQKAFRKLERERQREREQNTINE